MSEVGITDDLHLVLRLHSKLSDLRTQVIDLAVFVVHFVLISLIERPVQSWIECGKLIGISDLIQISGDRPRAVQSGLREAHSAQPWSFFSAFGANGNKKLYGFFSVKGKRKPLRLRCACARLLSDSPFPLQRRESP
jgi:hypothetical protein